MRASRLKRSRGERVIVARHPIVRGAYLDEVTERWAREEQARERAESLIGACAELGLDQAGHVVEAVNAVAPEDGWRIVAESKYGELLEAYEELRQRVEGIQKQVDGVDHEDPEDLEQLALDLHHECRDILACHEHAQEFAIAERSEQC